jgi:ribonuclease P protein component
MIQRSQRYSFKKGLPRKVLQSPFFLLRYQKNSAEVFHAAVVVNKKVSKSAVVRHRVKRVFIESLLSVGEKQAVPFDLVFFLRPMIIEKDREAVYNELVHIFKKL